MKAYIVHNLNGRLSGLVMAPNLKEAARLLGTSVHNFRSFGYQLASGEDLALAEANPGTAFIRKIGGDDPWVARESRKERPDA